MANTAPSLTGVTATLEASEQTVNSGAIDLLAGATFADPYGNFAGAQLAVTGLLGEDRVQINPGLLTGNVVTMFGLPIGTFTGGIGTDLIVTFNADATVSDISHLLRTLYYSNPSDTPAPSRRLLINFVDGDAADLGPLVGGGAGERGVAVTIAITAVNDAPTVDLNGPGEWIDNAIVHLEGTVTRIAPHAVIIDRDSPNMGGGRLSITVSRAALSVIHDGDGAGQIGVSGSSVRYGGVAFGTITRSGNGGLTVELIDGATPDAVQALVRNIGYSTDGQVQDGQTRRFMVSLTDNLGTPNYGSFVDVTLRAVNDAPVITTGAIGKATYNDGYPAMIVDWGLQIADPDNTSLISATVRITNGYRPGEDVLELTDQRGGIASSWDAATGTMTLTLTGTAADGTIRDWQAVLQDIGFRTIAPNATAGVRTISFTVNDGTNDSNVHVRDLTVQLINDAPLVHLAGLGGTDTQARYIEQGEPILIAPDAIVTDIDSANFAGGTFRITQFGGAISAEHVVSIQNQGNDAGQIGLLGSEVRYGGTLIGTIVAGSPGTPLSVSLNASATNEAVQAMIRAVTYYNPSNTPTIFVNYTFEIIEADGVRSFGAKGQIFIEQVDDPFIFDLDGTAPGTGATGGYSPGTVLSPIAPFAVFSDDDSQFQGARLSVRITNPQAGDTLGMFLGTGPDAINLDGDLVIWRGNMIGSIQLVTAGYGILTFTNFPPGEAIQAVLRAIGYGNTGANPTGSRTISFDFAPQGQPPVTLSATIQIAAAGEPIALPDQASVTEGAAVDIAVLSNDSDSDGPPPAVGTINGTSISVGQSVTLGSGATVTLNADGTLRYDTGTAFNHLVAPATAAAVGAANGQANDSFSYVLAGSNAAATVTITVNGTDNPGDRLGGSAGNDTIGGTDNADFYDLSQGGDDNVAGGDGNDAFYFGAAFTGADRVDGGAGTNDQVALQGMYVGGAALVLEAATLSGVEVVTLLGGGFNRYDITTVDGNVPAGGVLTFFGTNLGTTNNFTFNGSAETDGGFRIYGGGGTDLITTGGGNDGIWFGPGRFNPAVDRVDGGGGNDQLALDGVYDLVLDGTIIRGIETLTLQGRAGNSFTLSALDNYVGAGETKTIWGLLVANGISIDLRAETDGNYRIFGGRGNDGIIGGAGNDWIFGGEGADLLAGAGGRDTFFYDGVSQSTGAGFDTIVGFDPLIDRIDLPFELTGIAATVTGGSLSMSSFDADLTALLGSGQLGIGQAVLLEADAGSLAGNCFLVVDANGIAGYQGGEDYVIRLLNPPDDLRAEAFV